MSRLTVLQMWQSNSYMTKETGNAKTVVPARCWRESSVGLRNTSLGSRLTLRERRDFSSTAKYKYLVAGSIVCLLLLAAAGAQADDLDALKLADQPAQKTATASDWRWYAEAALVQSSPRASQTQLFNQRLSLELQLDQSIAPGWRALLADRLDLNWQQQPARQDGVNSLKEAYLSWQKQP